VGQQAERALEHRTTLAEEVLARAGLRQVHADGKRMRQARSPDSKET
jgi:hypothetical protein